MRSLGFGVFSTNRCLLIGCHPREADPQRCIDNVSKRKGTLIVFAITCLAIELQRLEFIGEDHFSGRFFLDKLVVFLMVLALLQISFGY